MEDRGLRTPARATVLVDATAVNGLEQSLGYERSQELVEDTIYRITDAVAHVERAMERGDSDCAAEYARDLIGFCARIGLNRMGVVAADLAEVIAVGDSIAADAVSARLVRLAEESLFCLVTLDATS